MRSTFWICAFCAAGLIAFVVGSMIRHFTG